MEMFVGLTGTPLIIVQTVGALFPFILSFLLWKLLKKVRLRIARKYFEYLKTSAYWSEISKRKFTQETEIYAYDFEELVAPGEHLLHPCIRGLRERQMYEELPGLEKIRNRFCWSIRVMGVVWVASFFAAFYFSAMGIYVFGDVTGYVLYTLQVLSYVTPIFAMYLSFYFFKKDMVRIVQDYYHHIKNSEYWQDVLRQDFMINVLRSDPKLENFGAPADPYATLVARRDFITPFQIHFMEQQMYEEIPELEKLYKKYHRLFLRKDRMAFYTPFGVAFLSILILQKIGIAAGIALATG